jgi:signal transduction histidine kinase/CheY-like chemotaxis protein/HPt (histidine-containing phosphotransfer) domain-containing protein
MNRLIPDILTMLRKDDDGNLYFRNPIITSLILAFTVMLAVFFLSVLWSSEEYEEITDNKIRKSIEEILPILQQDEANSMTSMLESIVRIEAFKTHFITRNRSQLLNESNALFHIFRKQYNITHFYFSTPDRVNLLRVHHPERFGDTISRYTTLQAERTKKVASGIELGPFGTFTLRVVMPWKVDGQLIGYIELGKEINHLFYKMKTSLGIDFIKIIDKKFIQRESWESGMAILGYRAEWDRFKTVVLTGSTLTKFPYDLNGFINRLQSDKVNQSIGSQVEKLVNSRHLFIFPLRDVSGHTVGRLIAIYDDTPFEAVTRQHLITIMTTCLFVAGFLLSILIIILKRVEKHIHDVNTTRKHAEEEALIAKERAQQSDLAKSAFLATMSHEIRTPLNSVIGLNEHLLDLEEDSERRHYLELAKMGGESLLALINDILDLSKIEASQLELETTCFNLPDLVHNTVKIVHTKAEEKGLSITVAFSPDVKPGIIGDPQRLRQILLNLIGNAIKFTEAGEVNVEVKCGGQDQIHFTIADTGIGIPNDQHENIFKPFTQADNSSTRNFGGTGLGLDICQRLVSLMGGLIWVESEPGKGSQFHFTARLPGGEGKLLSKLDRRLHSRKEIEGPMQPMHILLAEDVEENAIVIQAYLGKTPYSLDVVLDGSEAFKQFLSGKYDLILMDVQMPVMDGYVATRKIRAWEKKHDLPAIPILALTAHALQDVTNEILKAGCDMHLTKPISKDRLLGVIHYFSSNMGSSGVTKPVQEQKINSAQEQKINSATSLNKKTIDRLRHDMGGDIDEPIKLFLNKITERVADIDSAVSGQAPAQLESTAHKLKGTAATMGAERLNDICLQLEIMGKNGSCPKDGELLAEIKKEALIVEKMLSACLQEPANPDIS